MALTKIPGNLIATGAVTGDVLADGGIATAKLANDAVTTDKILDANITHAKLHTSMDLTGKTVTVATASGSTNTTAAASTAFVQQELTTLIGGAPGTLDTLNELAAAINDDANYNTTLTTALATKLPLAGGTMTGDLRLSDGVELELGDNAEFKIKHHASGYTHLENTVGTLYIDSDSVTFRDDDGSPTNLLVNQTGISVTGDITTTVDGNAYQLYYTESRDFITHSGATAVIKQIDNDTNNAKINFNAWDNSTIMTVMNSGKVGIGTDAPTHGLTVSDLSGGDDANMRRITIKSETHGVNSGFRFDSESANGTARGGGYYFNPGDTDATTYLGLSATDADYQMAIARNGNVGIGTTDPTAKLHVFKGESGAAANNTDSSLVLENSSHTYINFLTPASKEAGILWGDDVSANTGMITYSHVTDNMTITAADDIILNADKINVGNNKPLWSGSYGGGLFLKGNNATSDRYAQLCIVDSTGAIVLTGLVVRGGNVGIGTDTPDYQLDIENSSHAVARLHAGTNSSASLRLQNDAQHWDVNLQTNDKFAIYDHTAGTQPFTIMPTTNNVGIGVDTPTAKFHVADGSLMVSPYSNNSHAGAYHIIGSVANYSTANGRYIHAQLSTPLNLMFHIIMEGYTYTTGQRAGKCSGYVYNYAGGGNAATGAFGGPGVYDGRISGNIVAMHSNQNNARIEIVIDTGNTGTGNRWGSYSLVGGNDHITSYSGVEVVQYTTSSTGARQYTS